MSQNVSQNAHVPTRRSVLAGLGAGAFGGLALAGDPAGAALGEPTIPSNPVVKFYLNVTTIPGSSQVTGFVNQIPVTTWGWGVDAPWTVGGSGGGTGKPVPQDVVLLAPTGIQSPKILSAVNTAKSVASMVLSCVKGAQQPMTFMTLKFDNLFFTSYYVTPDPTDGSPLDLVHVKFAAVTQKFIPQKPDGSPGTAVTTTFDYLRNAGT
jgi:type VI protein secretion system component Hcp